MSHFIKKQRERGQSTIEFLLTLTFLFGFLFLYAKIAFNYTNGYLIQYATFMASRSYMVYDSNSIEEGGADVAAKNFAEVNVFRKIVPSIGLPLKANHPGESLGSLYTGLYFDFVQNFAFSNTLGGRVPMSFRSESFLGREPTRGECLRRIKDSFRFLSGVEEYPLNATFDDNGC